VAAPPQVLRGLAVLAADDNATNRRLLEATLTRWGVVPTIVPNGRAVLDALEEARIAGRPFGLVLLDSRMPDLGGLAVAECIRKEPRLADLTLVLLTSDVMVGDLARCRELRIARHLVKPFAPSELLDAVLLALGQPVEPSVGALSGAQRSAATAVPRLNVLVAEDNPVNQLLIGRLLEKMGHVPVITGNGQEAVDTYATQSFDVALMDVQMPVMDGLAATAAIREREARNPGGRRLPIMALTAFAMRGDRERCLGAGMDDYLTKPIKPEELSAALGRLLGDDRTATVPLAAAPAEAEPMAEGFDLTAALKYVGGDRELLDELLGIFTEDAPVRIEAIRQAIARGNTTELTREAHTLKGALKVIGATTASGLAMALEEASRAGDADSSEKLAKELEREMDRLLQSLMASRRG
jgi:CheY-like chemotaxis protein/HPt (histidine-containing phosphotransfer) domain-containing protein